MRRVSSETEEFLVMQLFWEPLLCPPPAPAPAALLSSSPPNSSLIVVVVVAQPSLFCLLKKFVEVEVEVEEV